MRVNLRDAIADLSPPMPPCFLNQAEWLGYLDTAAAAQTQKNEPKIIIIINGEPAINFDFHTIRKAKIQPLA